LACAVFEAHPLWVWFFPFFPSYLIPNLPSVFFFFCLSSRYPSFDVKLFPPPHLPTFFQLIFFPSTFCAFPQSSLLFFPELRSRICAVFFHYRVQPAFSFLAMAGFPFDPVLQALCFLPCPPTPLRFSSCPASPRFLGFFFFFFLNPVVPFPKTPRLVVRPFPPSLSPSQGLTPGASPLFGFYSIKCRAPPLPVGFSFLKLCPFTRTWRFGDAVSPLRGVPRFCL